MYHKLWLKGFKRLAFFGQKLNSILPMILLFSIFRNSFSIAWQKEQGFLRDKSSALLKVKLYKHRCMQRIYPSWANRLCFHSDELYLLYEKRIHKDCSSWIVSLQNQFVKYLWTWWKQRSILVTIGDEVLRKWTERCYFRLEIEQFRFWNGDFIFNVTVPSQLNLWLFWLLYWSIKNWSASS